MTRLSLLALFLIAALLSPACVPGGAPAAPPPPRQCMGMTWRVKHLFDNGGGPQFTLVGSDKVTNPYKGDTPCNVALPVLCIHKVPIPQPRPIGERFTYRKGWSNGIIKLSRPVPGASLTSLAAANDLCRAEFGPAFRMAEFHDGGGGWNWWGIGAITAKTRFWVYINDQRANPWN